MRTKIFILGLVLCSLTGCTQTWYVGTNASANHSYSTFTKAVEGEELKAVMKNSSVLRVRNISAQADSVSWYDLSRATHRTVATADILRVERKDVLAGAVDGLLLGAAVGAGIATLSALILKGDLGGSHGGVGLAIIGYGSAGGVLGLGVGAAIGHTTEYRFLADTTHQ
ncbi:MAG: hypothetical protein KF749_07705 [Bacteroidetes bacterium]|nr:hypothetical protein [Bacteroidota bacterium]MCW5894970.1 hypothetical protein [Bacteroidota bacterium]